MTEQEIKQQIDAEERQILTAYNDLIRAAGKVALVECHPTVSELSRAVQAASIKKILVCILSNVIGFAFCFCENYIVVSDMYASDFLCIFGIIGWVAIVYCPWRMASNKLDRAEAEYNSMVKIDEQVKSERSHLYSILKNTKI